MFSKFPSLGPRAKGPEAAGPLAEALGTTFSMEGAKPSIISEHVILTGNIRAPGAFHVEGCILGDLEVASVTIGLQGRVEGHIRCERLQIRGTFRGSAACGDLEVATGARVDAQIRYRTVTVHPGAHLQGELQVLAEALSPPLQPARDGSGSGSWPP